MTISSTDIETQAKAPEKTATDEGTVVERPIDELIQADRYNKAASVEAVPFGMRVARCKFPGTP